MRISKIFNLGKSQQELDFVDIDVSTDTPLFIDPVFLSIRNDKWSIDAVRSIRSFFQHIIDLIKSDNLKKAKQLFEYLSEPNETRLGVSKNAPNGKGVGFEDTRLIFENLVKSKAVETGLVEDLEDCVIFVDGFGKDKLSDMSTNIIKKHLIEYTQSQCRLWNIPLTPNVPTGFFWDKDLKEWRNEYTDMLVVNGEKILLTPKGIVTFSKEYTSRKFHQHFVLNFLQDEHLRLNTALVETRINKKTGETERYVTKKKLIQHGYTSSKKNIRKFTEEHPEVFAEFKGWVKRKGRLKSLSHQELQDIQSDSELIEDVIDYLIEKLKSIPSGREHASEYHKLAVGIMSLLFYPNLTAPQVEQEIHDGRKRIDITFDNSALEGFFYLLHTKHNTPCQYIFMECKNYSKDPENPELDQLAGRFSWNRGKFGILLCREISNMELFLDRCRDTAYDDRGIIIPIVDSDLIYMLTKKKEGQDSDIEKVLFDRLRRIMLR
ncbi:MULTISPECIES: hypothetical protein [Parageobacillus]|jgi:hypothetical protein|uniref:Restriction endonuclease n=1 Tax=Parageobacillus thermoglucosidasius TaxID=1426 RepID=A0AB38QXJ9_PARTM|nr:MULTISPECIES: hypothetical protein [Parageobacillus]MED4990894.1 hypothetical protein [Parageobacillus toebii]UOE75840.1 hypothetical protein IMI45_16335 [Parageobacillus thermoglucosidasius]